MTRQVLRLPSREKAELGLLVQQWPGAVREHIFHPTRKWRLDWAWPSKKLGLEYDGLFSAKSRHTTVTGMTEDHHKFSEAAILGWCVIRVTAPMIRDGRAYSLLKAAHEGRDKPCQSG